MDPGRFLVLSVTSNDGSTLINEWIIAGIGDCNRNIRSSDIEVVMCGVNESNRIAEVRFIVNVTSMLTVNCRSRTHILHPLRK